MKRFLKPAAMLGVCVCLAAIPACKKRSPVEAKFPKPVPTPTINPDTIGPILFTSERDDGYHLFAMQPDGSGLLRLLINATSGTWSSDGKRIAFVRYIKPESRYHLFVMSANGTNVTQITDDSTPGDYIRAPSWSPDGAYIAFELVDGWEHDIYKIKSDGSELTNLTNTVGISEIFPDWSPDGTKILFENDFPNRIAEMNPDGSGLNTIRSTGHQPSWSPDGSKIAFREEDSDGDYEIFYMNSDGTGVTQVTSDLLTDLEPTWSPDGQKIAYIKLVSGGYYDYEIYVINVDGSSETNITNDPAGDTGPEWLW